MKRIFYALIILTLISGGIWLVRPDGNRPVGNKADSANTKRLIERVNEAIEDGDLQAAKKALSQLTKATPGSTAVKRLTGQIDRAEAAADHASSDDITGDNTTTGDASATPAKKSEPGQTGATPLSVLPAAIDGYKVSNAWLKPPTMAGGTYQPEAATVTQEVERVFSTVVKSKTTKEAKARLAAEISKFPDNQAPVRVNGKPAYSGTYGGVMTVAWVKGKWFFSVQAVPGPEPSVASLRNIAVDVAEKLGV